MKSILAPIPLAVASALKAQDSHEYFWEPSLKDSRCPVRKACMGYGFNKISYDINNMLISKWFFIFISKYTLMFAQYLFDRLACYIRISYLRLTVIPRILCFVNHHLFTKWFFWGQISLGVLVTKQISQLLENPP